VTTKERRFRSIIGTPLATRTRIALGAIGVGLAIAAYAYYSYRQQQAGEGKQFLGPGLDKLWTRLGELTSEDKRTETTWLWVDTISSLKILMKGLGIGVAFAVVLGVLMGVFSTVHALLSPVVTAIAKVPPTAVLPIFFILVGAGDGSKLAIIAVGIAPTLANGIVLCAQAIPRNTIVKAYSLGASTPEVVVKVILPIILPQIVEYIRLTIGPAWVYLIAGEALTAASEGLGYRIFVTWRNAQVAMSTAIIYCIWIAILGVLMDYALALVSRLVAPWAAVRKDD
jgi:NitT/TauT family transport system permease protein